MTKTTRDYRCGWLIRCVGVTMALAFCASAFADPSKNVVSSSKQQPVRSVRKVCYTYITGSAIAQPCDRLGAIPTTANSLTILGSYPTGK